MKKILTILILLSFCFIAKSQYVVPRGYPIKNMSYYNFAAPGGFVLIDSLIMTRSHDTTMKPLYPSLMYWQNTGVDSAWWQWDMVRWSKIGSGGGSGGVTTFFALTDVDSSGIQDGYIPYYDATSGNILFEAQGTSPIASGTTTYQVQDSTNTPPVSFPTGFDTTYWMVGGAGTGIFSGNNYKIALYINGVFDSFITPTVNDWALTLDDNIWHQYDGATWPRRNAPIWLTTLNLGGGLLGSSDNTNVFFRRRNINQIIFQNNGVRFPQLTGASDGLMGINTVGLSSNVQVGSGLQLSGGTLSSTATGTVTDVTATSPITSSGGTTPNISTSMSANKLIGRYSGGTGVMQEVTIGSGLSMDGSGNLTATGSSFNVYAPLIKSGDTISQRFNVLHYGADPTGVLDATEAIQNAINACNTAGGGVVYFPRGTYLIAGALQTNVGGINMNCQLYIPNSTANGVGTNKNHIILMGEAAPNFTNAINPSVSGGQLSTGGVILKSTLTTGATGAAVIGTKGTTGSFGDFNYTYLSVINILIQVKNNPAGAGPVIGGISYKYGASLFTNNVVVITDTTSRAQVVPTNNVSGIETPDVNSESMSTLQNTFVARFRYGITSGEHTVLNNAQAFSCYYGFNFKQGYQLIKALAITSSWNTNDVVFTGGVSSVLISSLNIEIKDSATYWQKNIYTINDSLNYGTGQVYMYNLNEQFSTATYPKNGAANLLTYTTNGGVPGAANIFTQRQKFGTPTVVSTFNDNRARYQGQGLVYVENKSTDATNNAGFAGVVAASSTFPFVAFRRALGTIASPTATTNNDVLGSIGAGGYESTNGYNATSSATINFQAAGTFSNTSWPTRIVFATTASGSTSITDRWRINENGYFFGAGSRIGIGTGTTEPAVALEIAGTGSTNGGVYFSGSAGGALEGFFYKDAGGSQRSFFVLPGSDVVALANRASNGTVQVRANNSTAGAGGESVIGTFNTNGLGLKGATSATAYLHIGAGTATASTAPFKLTTGTSLTTAEAGALEYTTPRLFFTNGRAVRQEIPQIQQARVTTQFDKTSSASLSNITGLSVNVAASGTYRFEVKLYTTSNTAGGVQAAIGGTATATNIIYEGLSTDAGLTTQSRATALGTAVGAVTAVTAAYIQITGTITVNAAGTLTVQFAQNVSNGTASSVLVGSTFVITEMN